MDIEPVTTPEPEGAAKPAVSKARRLRDILLIGGGAVIALVIALVAGVPFGADEAGHAAEPAAAAGHEAFPPKLEEEAAHDAKPPEDKQESAAPEHAPAAAHPETEAPLSESAKPAAAMQAVSGATEGASLTGLARDWQRALDLEAQGDAAGAVTTLRAAVASLEGRHSSVRRLALLALGALEARRGQTAAATRAFADADAACNALVGAELIAFGKACLEAGAPRLARMAASRTSLVARTAAATDPALVLSVTRLHAEALDAEWRQSHGGFVLPEPVLSFEGASR